MIPVCGDVPRNSEARSRKRVSLVVPPVHAVVNELGHGYLPPLGLLSIGGPLVDAGFDVELVDADAGHLTMNEVVSHLKYRAPDAVLIGHSGSVAANPIALELMRAVKSALPHTATVYGGVYASFAAEAIMQEESAVDFVVRGEGEVTVVELLDVLRCGDNGLAGARFVNPVAETARELGGIPGLVWRDRDRVVTNPWRPPLTGLDHFRVAWELCEWPLYESPQRGGRAAVVQFSRGCPNRCTYCGQWRFWRRWRHRSVGRFVDELQLLHDRHGVRTVFVADENWACDAERFRALLVAIAERRLDLDIYCAMCAADVVRDAGHLDLYRRAGIICLMLGVESLDPEVLERVGKHNPYATTHRAVELLRRFGTLSVVNVIYGLRDETWRSVWETARRLRALAPDFFNALHLTPLPWTAEGRGTDRNRVVQTDQTLWDFRHPVVQPSHLSLAGMAAAVKLSELYVFARPLRLLRRLCGPDRRIARLLGDALPRMAHVYLWECVSLSFMIWRLGIRAWQRARALTEVQRRLASAGADRGAAGSAAVGESGHL
jgi:anaerobic magnesium-protoporphyrin IX monomethyl ester cyclase